VRGRVRHAVVVGASSGIGKLLAEALADDGIALSAVGRSPPADPRIWHRRCDDLSTLDWRETYARAESHAGVPIDAVVYVVGDAVFGRASATPVERARRLFDVNYWAPVGAATAAEHLWKEPRHGTFVSVSSISARRAVPFEAHYGASKAAFAQFLDVLGLEQDDARLRFVSVYPGRLRTAFRSKAEWYGLPPDPRPSDGRDPATVVGAILGILAGQFRLRVLGIRERAIDLADRVSPTLYDSLVLRRRVRSRLHAARREAQPEELDRRKR
jgi:NAD(P)-dependent dehydrogenase (short-subunit alcohol dehydrogenase family)